MEKSQLVNKNAKSIKKEPDKELKRTHLYLNDKYLQEIAPIKNPSRLLVLYLHNNVITQIENLGHAYNLTSLYLQRNRLTRIEKLENLKKLKRLYLGHNSISVVEGLENLMNLEELHIERQDLPPGQILCFDPRSMMAVSKTLQVLNISHNNITSLAWIDSLRYLKVLNAAHNLLDDMDEVCSYIRNLFYLNDATFLGNPIAKKHRYRETVIANTYCLGSLDSKTITEETRCFIKRFEKEKMVRGSRQSVNLADDIPNLPRNYPPPVQKSVSASIIRDARRKLFKEGSYETFDERNAVYIPWKALPKHSARLPSILKKPKIRNESSITAVSILSLNNRS